jgi:hypothetical protein
MRPNRFGPFLLFVVAVLVGCGSSATPAETAGTSLSPLTTPSPNLTALCRIPLSWTANLSNSLPMEGFMDLTTGQVSDVPAAHLQVAGDNLAKSPGSPVLIGWPTGDSYYDAPQNRWLPALGQWVSPDGASYLYLDFDASELHIVDVASGADRVLVAKRLFPLAWTPDRVYVMDYGIGLGPQTYSVSVPGGVLTPLGAKLNSVVPVSGTGAWDLSVSPTLPHVSGENGPISNSISRVDLVSGQKVEWFSAANATVTILGFTQSGSPLIESTTSAGTVLVRLSAPDTVAETYALAHAAVGSATDAHGTWLLDDKGEVLIYNEGGSPNLLATAPTSLGTFRLDGGCARR